MLSRAFIYNEKDSAVSIIDELITYAEKDRASDIHIDPCETTLEVRMRVDGVLRNVVSLSRNLHDSIISRIKILGRLRTDEHTKPHDGRFKTVCKGKTIHVRISICPTYYGENAVLRLLGEGGENLSLQTLGFSPGHLSTIEKQLRSSSGMILSTGPTGSGKTTTLYALLKSIATPELSIITIEDPVEYALPGVRQIEVNPETKLGFSTGLRSILRQDPNVIMVGEIRDTETAMVAVNTSLTGHLLLSTLHTNDAATTLPRLLDMNIEPYLIASTVRMAIGQRLVRKVCTSCKRMRVITELEKRWMSSFGESILPENIFFGEGCEKCFHTGFFGRAILCEVLVVTDKIREAIMCQNSAHRIKEIAEEEGMRTLFHDGLLKVGEGITTLEEVFRVINEA